MTHRRAFWAIVAIAAYVRLAGALDTAAVDALEAATLDKALRFARLELIPAELHHGDFPALLLALVLRPFHYLGGLPDSIGPIVPWARFAAAIVGVGSVVVGGSLATRLFGRGAVALLTMLIVAVNPLHVL